ncbi:MAG: hypothetical protein IT282_18135 [Bacteroidetes bacterium]|nr:hypothetical protein [Bacteroidota bacterium]
MRRQLLDHLYSIVVVIAVFFGVLLITESPQDAARQSRDSAIAPYLDLDFLDFGSPLDRALLKEAIASYYPNSPGRGDSLLAAIDAYRREAFTTPSLKSGAEKPGLTPRTLARLAPMYVQFVLLYLVVLVLNAYGARMIGTYRFIRTQQGRLPAFLEFLYTVAGQRKTMPPAARLAHGAGSLLRCLVNGLAYVFLFAPAYVIAYSFKSNIEGGAYLFMIVLGVISNGMLVTYANRFYTFLMHESSRGYVDTALVKGLNASYAWNTPDGLPRKVLLRPSASARGHVFHHIYTNARFLYIPAIKQQASFLITGLVIIEMALNIQGHLCYELLQNILYGDYEIAAGIVAGIFLVVKATEILVDVWFTRETRRYENAYA